MTETRFIHITDLHVGQPGVPDDHLFSDTSATLRRVLEMIAEVDPAPQFIIASGDLSNRGSAESYRHLGEIMQATGLPVFYALGNHDNRAGFYQGSSTRPRTSTRHMIMTAWSAVCMSSCSTPARPARSAAPSSRNNSTGWNSGSTPMPTCPS